MKRCEKPIVLALFGCWIIGFGFAVWQSSQAPPNNRPKTASQRTTNHETAKLTTDERLANYTWWLAILTGALVVTAVAQGFFIARSEKTARIAAIAARDTAIKTSEMADAADKQFKMAGLQADLQEKQHGLARLQFIASHRPRLRVRHVSIIDPGEIIGTPTFFFDPNCNVRGGLSVVNVGGSSAIIIETRYRIFASRTWLPAIAPYDLSFRSDLLIRGQKLGMGESCATPIEDTLQMGTPEEGVVELRKFESEGWVIFVMGQIRYQDEGGNDRFMGFCRARQNDGKFLAVDDSDYEYED
jgi:hypothetical protein